MKKIFVIGDKTSKSLSPLIFNHWLKKYKIKAKYGYKEIKKKDFNKNINKILKQKDTIGLNVTIPFKKNLISFLDKADKHVKNIGAVNCITIKNNKLFGTNTDWIGYKKCLEKNKLSKKSKIIIIGYGGASKAVCYYFFKERFNNVIVFNRTKKLVKKHPKKQYSKNLSLLSKHLGGASLLINTTPINPIKPKQIRLIGNKTTVSDIVYLPKNTAFLRQFKKNKKIFGIEMLINQAIPCFEKWFGFKPSLDKKLINKIEKLIK